MWPSKLSKNTYLNKHINQLSEGAHYNDFTSDNI